MIKKMFIVFVFMLGLASAAFAEQTVVKDVPIAAAQAASAAEPIPAKDGPAVWFNLIFTVVCISAMMGYIGYVLEAQLGKK